MATSTVALPRDAGQVGALLDSPEIAALIADLRATRWTGRPGYPLCSMVGLALVKSLYAIPTWTRTVALVRDHAGLRDVLGAVPSTDAAYRFTVKLREHKSALEACLAKVLAALHSANPEMGNTVAIDGSDLPAYANGQRYVKRGGELRKRFADPDATWGHRSSISTRSGGGYYGFKVHAAVDTATGLPVAWTVKTAKDSEIPEVPDLLDAAAQHGFAPGTCILDRGYDTESLYGSPLLSGLGLLLISAACRSKPGGRCSGSVPWRKVTVRDQRGSVWPGLCWMRCSIPSMRSWSGRTSSGGRGRIVRRRRC